MTKFQFPLPIIILITPNIRNKKSNKIKLFVLFETMKISGGYDGAQETKAKP